MILQFNHFIMHTILIRFSSVGRLPPFSWTNLVVSLSHAKRIFGLIFLHYSRMLFHKVKLRDVKTIWTFHWRFKYYQPTNLERSSSVLHNHYMQRIHRSWCLQNDPVNLLFDVPSELGLLSSQSTVRRPLWGHSIALKCIQFAMQWFFHSHTDFALV